MFLQKGATEAAGESQGLIDDLSNVQPFDVNTKTTEPTEPL